MTLTDSLKEKMETGRGAADGYRAAHARLHAGGWYPEIHQEHTRLLKKLRGELAVLGFGSVSDFFDQSELFNLTELGLTN